MGTSAVPPQLCTNAVRRSTQPRAPGASLPPPPPQMEHICAIQETKPTAATHTAVNECFLYVCRHRKLHGFMVRRQMHMPILVPKAWVRSKSRRFVRFICSARCGGLMAKGWGAELEEPSKSEIPRPHEQYSPVVLVGWLWGTLSLFYRLVLNVRTHVCVCVWVSGRVLLGTVECCSCTENKCTIVLNWATSQLIRHVYGIVEIWGRTFH